jgi:hypothetical protein
LFPVWNLVSSVGCFIFVALLQTAGRQLSTTVSLALVADGSARKSVSPYLFDRDAAYYVSTKLKFTLPVVKTWVTSTVTREVAGSNPAAVKGPVDGFVI